MATQPLPSAVQQTPACGVCHADTTPANGHFACYDCGLAFDRDTLTARFLDPESRTCAQPCDNTWHHRPGAIWPDKAFECGTCQLPSDHDGGWHWCGCVAVPYAGA
jgi:hypothetical protein